MDSHSVRGAKVIFVCHIFGMQIHFFIEDTPSSTSVSMMIMTC